MEFLVRIDVKWPSDRPDHERDELVRREAQSARELADDGTLVRLWRVPGRWSNIGIWSAGSATDLHTALSRLPFFPYLDITVEPLASHPNDPPQKGGQS